MYIFKIFRIELSLRLIMILSFVIINKDPTKAFNSYFYFYIKTTFRSLFHLQVKDYTNFEYIQRCIRSIFSYVIHFGFATLATLRFCITCMIDCVNTKNTIACNCCVAFSLRVLVMHFQNFMYDVIRLRCLFGHAHENLHDHVVKINLTAQKNIWLC